MKSSGKPNSVCRFLLLPAKLNSAIRNCMGKVGNKVNQGSLTAGVVKGYRGKQAHRVSKSK